MAKAKGQMDDTQIESLVGTMINEAQTFINDSIEPDRAKATAYYKGDPFGTEETGRSKVIMTEVRDVVLGQLWPLLRIFVGPERVVEFRPREPEDGPVAKQQTDYVNYVFMEDNPGPMILHAMLKDGLIRRTGFVKWWWDESEKIEHQDHTGLSDEDLETLLADEEVVLDVTNEETVQVPLPDMPGAVTEMTVYDVTVTRTTTDGVCRVMEVPPEEVLWNRTARKFPDDTRIVVHATERRLDELVAMGFDEDELRDLVGPMEQKESLAKDVRQIAKDSQATTNTEDTQPDETRPIRYDEAYTRLNVDGKVKLWKLCMAGEQHKLLDKQPVSHIPLAMFCPDPEPHTVQGRSSADDTMDMQRIQSDVARGMLDSLAQVIDPATMVLEDMVEMKDMLNTERNRIIRVRQPEAVKEFKHTFVGNEALAVMQFFDDRVEKRTGQSKASQGLDPDVLQSTAKAAVTATLTKAQERAMGIAFIFANTAMRDLFRGILRTVVENQDKPRTVRLRNEYVAVDPRAWNANMDVVVNVGLGTGLPEDRINLLGAVQQSQKEMLGMLGPTEFVSFGKLRTTLARMLELSGWRNVEEFYGEVTPDMEQQFAQQIQQQQQAAQQGGGGQEQVAQVLAQAEQAKAQVAQQRAQMDAEAKQEELALKRREMELRDDRERDKQAADFILAMAEIESKSATSLDREKIKADVDTYRAKLDAEGNAAEAMLDALKPEQPSPGESDDSA
jgi:hypothetical protein